MKDFYRLIISLAATCCIAAFALAFVFLITKTPIAKQHKQDTLKAIKEVMPPYDNDPFNDKINVKDNGSEVEFYLGKKNGQVKAIAVKTFGEGYAGNIYIMVGIDTKGEVTGIEILSNQETPGLGTRINTVSFRKQFIGKSLYEGKLVDGRLAVNKDGGDIDAITGATISSRGVTKALNNALTMFQKHQSEILGGGK